MGLFHFLYVGFLSNQVIFLSKKPMGRLKIKAIPAPRINGNNMEIRP
jgi:hypothetical protein